MYYMRLSKKWFARMKVYQVIQNMEKPSEGEKMSEFTSSLERSNAIN